MGQARLRGTFEERKAAAISRREAEVEKRRSAHADYERSLTPEQRMKLHEMRLLVAMAAAHSFNVIPERKNL